MKSLKKQKTVRLLTKEIKLFLKTLFKNLKFLCKNNLWDLKSTSEWANIEYIPETRKIRLFKEMQQNKFVSLKANILSYEDSIEYIIKNRCSLCRFGDGEFNIINGGDIPYQKYNPLLSKRLREILMSCFEPSANERNIKIAIGREYYDFSDWNNLIFPKFFEDYIMLNEDKLVSFCSENYEYLATAMSHLYNTFQEYDFSSYFEHIKEIWEKRDIVIICGERSFKNISYNIFDCAKSIEYLYAPTENAFDQYDEILDIAKAISKDKLIIAILGPTAKLIAWDLYALGYQAIDFGHIAKDYNSYIKKDPRNLETIHRFICIDD